MPVLLLGCDTDSSETASTESVDDVPANIGPLVTDNRDCSETSVFRFDAVSPDGIDNRRIFIDFANARSGTVTKGSLTTDSHFGGVVTNCSTDEVRCIDTGELVFAWPTDDAQTSFSMGAGQCQTARFDGGTHVSCYFGEELAIRYRVNDGAIDQVELFYPNYPDYPDAVFKASGEPLPLCKL